MAETPKGDTASPTDASRTDSIEPTEAETIAAGTGEDHVAPAGESSAGPWATDPADRVHPPADGSGDRDRERRETPSAAAGSGGLRRTLILVILLALLVGGGYATYPMWRGEVEPFARQLGFNLPEVETAEAPVNAPQTAEAPPAEAPQAETPSAPAGDQTQTSPTETAPAETAPAQGSSPQGASTEAQAPSPPAQVDDPTLAGEIDRLRDRVDALEQRLTAIADRPATPAGADPQQVEQLEARLEEMAQRLTAVTDEMTIVREGLATGGGGEGLGPMASQLSDRLQGLTDRIAALEQAETQDAQPSEQVQALTARVAALEAAPAQPSVAPQRVETLQARIDTLAGSLDSEVRNSAEDVAKLETRLSDVQARLDEIAKALESTRSGREKAGAFLLAANQLAAATNGSGAFEAELEALRAAAPAGDDVAKALEALEKHAGGVPSLAVLRNRFAQTASSAVDASVVGSGEGFVGQALTRVASLVTIRRTDVAEGEGLDALLARAEAALAAGDLAAAIEAVTKLEGDPAQAASPWLADAQARAEVNVAVRTLQAKALAGVAGG